MEPFGLVNVGRATVGRVGDRAVAALATAQHGLVTVAQLRFCGLSHDAIRHRVKAGRLFRVHRGVYLVGHLARDELSPFAAAILAVGPNALLSHASALWIWGIIDGPPQLVDVSIRSGAAVSRSGVRVHRAYGLASSEIRERRGLPVVSPAAALLDLADGGDAAAVERALNEGREKRLIQQRDLERVMERSPGRAGLAVLGTFLHGQVDEDFSRKEAERLMWKLIKAAGLPRPRRNVTAEGYERDFWWPDLRLNVETDGVRWHASRRKLNSDRRRDADSSARGIQVLRFTWDQLQHPERALARLAATIALLQARREHR